MIPHGRDVEVTASNVYDYVRKYADYRMVKSQEKAIDVSQQHFLPLLAFCH